MKWEKKKIVKSLKPKKKLIIYASMQNNINHYK